MTMHAPHESTSAEGLTAETIARLVDSHARFLAFLERRVGARETAEEILQEAYARALQRGDALRAGESAVAWFYRLLRNALVDHHRRRGAERRALESVATQPVAPEPLPDAELMQTVCGCVSALIETLKPEYAEIVRAIELDEQPLSDYAQRTGITSNNAAVRLHRAREALFKRLVQCCGTCATHGCLDCHCESTKGTPGCG